MDTFFNTPRPNVVVDGKQWFPSRTIRDIDGNIVYVIPRSSFVWNNTLFTLKGLFELVKVLAGSAVLIEAIRVLSHK